MSRLELFAFLSAYLVIIFAGFMPSFDPPSSVDPCSDPYTFSR